MAIKRVTDFAYFVTDTSGYFTQIVRYDPLVANQTLISPATADEETEELLVYEEFVDVEELRARSASQQEFLGRLTPSNRDLLQLARQLAPPPEWLKGDEQCPF